MINERELSEIIANAIQDVYLPAIVKATPKQSGDTANGWRVIIESNVPYLANIRFGHIVKFLEDGTNGPYVIEPVNAKALSFVSGNKRFFATKVIHPGIEARKFVQETLANENLKKQFTDKIDTDIQKMLDKL